MAWVRAALLVAAAWSGLQALGTLQPAPAAHGRERIAVHALSAEDIAAHALRPGQSDDAALWLGPERAAGIGRNPYTLELVVSARALAAGDAGLRWQAGWQVRESPVATRELLMPLQAAAPRPLTAGQDVTLTLVGTPVTFRGERRAAPMLRLVSADNLEVTSARLHVWSGTPPVGWPRWSTLEPAGLVLAAMCLAVWLVLRPRTDRVAAAQVHASAAAPPNTRPAPLTTVGPARPPAELPTAVFEPAAAPQPAHGARVLSALRDVLGAGLAVAAEPDLRPRRRSKAPRPATGR